MTTRPDSFYKDEKGFNELCRILAGEPAYPGVFIPSDSYDCAWGIAEAMLLSPPNEEDPFDPAIGGFIAHILKDEGIITPPDILAIADHDQKLAQQVNYDYADDPGMFEAIWSAEKEKTDGINRFVLDRLRMLSAQLRALPLTRGNPARAAHAMQKALGG